MSFGADRWGRVSAVSVGSMQVDTLLYVSSDSAPPESTIKLLYFRRKATYNSY